MAPQHTHLVLLNGWAVETFRDLISYAAISSFGGFCESSPEDVFSLGL